MTKFFRKFNEEEYVDMIERFNNDHINAGKRWFMEKAEIEPSLKSGEVFRLTIRSELRGTVSCVAYVENDEYDNAQNRAFFQAMQIFGY